MRLGIFNFSVMMFVTLLVTSQSSLCLASWERLGSAGGVSTYADPDTIKRNNNYVKMWTLLDFEKNRNLSNDKYRSTISLYEFDCKKDSMRFLSVAYYSLNMGLGDVVTHTQESGPWAYVAPNSIGGILQERACYKSDAR